MTPDTDASDPAPQTLMAALSSDHAAIQAMLVDPAVGAVGEEGLAAREELVMNLVRHFVAEEQYLYPTVREQVADGAALADANFAADRASERTLKSLEDTDIDAAGIAAALGSVRERFSGHVRRQEETIFPALARSCDRSVLIELARDVLGAEQLAPTRPRAVAPESAALNKVSSFVEGFIDHVRDSYTRRGVDPDAES